MLDYAILGLGFEDLLGDGLTPDEGGGWRSHMGLGLHLADQPRHQRIWMLGRPGASTHPPVPKRAQDPTSKASKRRK